jgi:hypothetical protein
MPDKNAPLGLPISSRGEWSSKRLSDDPERGKAYLPAANLLLGQLQQRMAFGGVNYGHRLKRLADGTLIRVIRNGEQNIIQVSPPRRATEPEPEPLPLPLPDPDPYYD